MLRFVVSPRCREGFADLEVLVEEIGARHEVDFRLLRREGKAVDWTTGLERDSTLVLCLDMEQDMVLCGMDGEYNDFLKQAAARTRGRVAIVMRGGASDREEVLYSMSDQMKAINNHHLLFFWEELLPMQPHHHGQAELTAERLDTAFRRVRLACASEAAALQRDPSLAQGVSWQLLVAAAALMLLGVVAAATLTCAPWLVQWPPPGMSFIRSTASSARMWEEQLQQRNESLNERELAFDQRVLALDLREKSAEHRERTIYARQQQAAKEEQRLREEAISLKERHGELELWNATLAASQRALDAKERRFIEWKQSTEAELQRRSAALEKERKELEEQRRMQEAKGWSLW